MFVSGVPMLFLFRDIARTMADWLVTSGMSFSAICILILLYTTDTVAMIDREKTDDKVPTISWRCDVKVASAFLGCVVGLLFWGVAVQAQTIQNGAITTVAIAHNNPHVYTNDDLAVYERERLANAPETPIASLDSATNNDTAQPTSDQKKPADAAKQQAELKRTGLKQTIALLEREIALDQRTLKLNDAYTNIDLRSTSENGEDLARERKALQAELQNKQRQLEEAKSQLQRLK